MSKITNDGLTRIVGPRRSVN